MADDFIPFNERQRKMREPSEQTHSREQIESAQRTTQEDLQRTKHLPIIENKPAPAPPAPQPPLTLTKLNPDAHPVPGFDSPDVTSSHYAPLPDHPQPAPATPAPPAAPAAPPAPAGDVTYFPPSDRRERAGRATPQRHSRAEIESRQNEDINRVSFPAMAAQHAPQGYPARPGPTTRAPGIESRPGHAWDPATHGYRETGPGSGAKGFVQDSKTHRWTAISTSGQQLGPAAPATSHSTGGPQQPLVSDTRGNASATITGQLAPLADGQVMGAPTGNAVIKKVNALANLRAVLTDKATPNISRSEGGYVIEIPRNSGGNNGGDDGGSGGSGTGARRVKTVAVHGDYLVCQTFSGTDSEILVAKPRELRHSLTSFTVAGVACSAAYGAMSGVVDGKRTVSASGRVSQTEIVIPVFYDDGGALSEIWADQPIDGTGNVYTDSGTLVQLSWMDTNRAGRVWCQL